MPETKSRKNNLILKRVILTLFFCLVSNLAFAATPINWGQTINGSISIAGEKKEYSFSAQANDKVTILWTELSGNLRLELYKPTGDRILFEYNSGKFDITLPKDGLYTIVVRGYYLSSTGTFQMSCTLSRPPRIISITPLNHSIFEAGTTVTTTVVANGDSPLEYQFYLDANLKQGWSDKSSFTWIPQNGDSGRSHWIQVEARNKVGTTEGEIYIFIAYKPPFPQ